MSIPVVVSPAKVTPGLYISVNLLAGAAAPGTGILRVLLIAPKAASGTLTVDTEIRAGGGPESAGVAWGVGTPGHLAAKQIYLKAPDAQIDFAAPTAGATAATLNITASNVPTGNTAVHFDIAGREFDVEWNSGESTDTFKTRAINAINAKTQDLPVTASSGGVGIITITGKVLGRISNDIRVKVTLITQTGTETVTGAVVYTNLSGGTTDADITTVLANASGREYAYILPCLSNTDAETTGSGSNVARVLTHVGNYNTGLNAKLQQVVIATTSATMTNTKTAAVSRNSQVLEWVYAFAARSLPCELAARELGGRLAMVVLDPAGNRIGELYDNVYGSADTIADNPTAAELEDALTNGITILAFNASSQLYLVRPITNYSIDSAGGADRRLLDVQNVDATYVIARDLRSALPQAFPNAKIAKDSLPGAEPPPRGVVEERDIKEFVISRVASWCRQGVALRSALDTAVANGELIVQVNPSDATQVDIVVPVTIIAPLAKIGVLVQRRPN
jgi:phage tail sheath gpL-like